MRYFDRSWPAALTIVAFMAVASPVSAQGDAKPLFEKSGELTEQDPQDKMFKCPSKSHEFRMEADKAYRIELVSKDFLPVLRLDSPDGKPLAVDFKGAPAASMIFKAPKDGDYRMIVATAPKKGGGAFEMGKYQLTVVEPSRADLFGLRLRELGKMPPQEREKTLQELLTDLQAKGEKLTIADGRLAATAVGSLEKGDVKGASDWCVKIGKALEAAEDERIKGLAKSLAGTARRLKLLGNSIDVTGPLLDGTKIDWASYRGKVVLVDFWATWCGPCVAEIPNMKRMYQAYHDKGFEIVGISLDRNVELPTEFMKKRELPWACIYEEKHPLASHYGVNAIPAAILVDKEGKVISLSARGPELGRLLEQQFGPIPDAKNDTKKSE